MTYSMPILPVSTNRRNISHAKADFMPSPIADGNWQVGDSDRLPILDDLRDVDVPIFAYDQAG